MQEGALKRAMNWLGWAQDVEYEEEDERLTVTQKKSSIIGLPTGKGTDVIVCDPLIFDDVQQIADYLKGRQLVIVNLQNVDGDLARRIVDFVSGVIYAIDGHFQKIKEDIFIFTPKNTNIVSTKKESKEGSFFLWGK